MRFSLLSSHDFLRINVIEKMQIGMDVPSSDEVRKYLSLLKLAGHIEGLEAAQDISLQPLEEVEVAINDLIKGFRDLKWDPPESVIKAQETISSAKSQYEADRQGYVDHLRKHLEGTPLKLDKTVEGLVEYFMRYIAFYPGYDDPKLLAEKGALKGSPRERVLQYISSLHGTQIRTQEIRLPGLKPYQIMDVINQLKDEGLACGPKYWVGVTPAGAKYASDVMVGYALGIKPPEVEDIKKAKRSYGELHRQALTWAINNNEDSIDEDTILSSGADRNRSQAAKRLKKLEDLGYVEDGEVTILGRRFASGKSISKKKKGKSRKRIGKIAIRSERAIRVLRDSLEKYNGRINIEVLKDLLPDDEINKIYTFHTYLKNRKYVEGGRLTKGVVRFLNRYQAEKEPEVGSAESMGPDESYEPAAVSETEKPVETEPVVAEGPKKIELSNWEDVYHEIVYNEHKPPGYDDFLFDAETFFDANEKDGEQAGISREYILRLLETNERSVTPESVRTARYVVNMATVVMEKGNPDEFYSRLEEIGPDAPRLVYYLRQEEEELGEVHPQISESGAPYDMRLKPFYDYVFSITSEIDVITGMDVMIESEKESMLLRLLGDNPDKHTLHSVGTVYKIVNNINSNRIPPELAEAIDYHLSNGYDLGDFLSLAKDYSNSMLRNRTLNLCSEVCGPNMENVLTEYKRALRKNP